jgi:cytochrome P450
MRSAPGALLEPATLADPYPFLAWAREHEPVFHVDDTSLYLVTTWDLVVDALTRVDDFSSNLNALVYTDDDCGIALFDMTPLGTNIQTLATADPPAHPLHRRAVFPNLVERKMATLEDFAADAARSLLTAGITDGHLDVTTAFANRLPMTVLCEVMGFPETDIDALIAYAFDGTELLAGYQAEVHQLTVELVGSISAERLDDVIDTNWDPPVTVAVRVVSVVEDCLQHLGQANYVAGLLAARR